MTPIEVAIATENGTFFDALCDPFRYAMRPGVILTAGDLKAMLGWTKSKPYAIEYLQRIELIKRVDHTRSGCARHEFIDHSFTGMYELHGHNLATTAPTNMWEAAFKKEEDESTLLIKLMDAVATIFLVLLWPIPFVLLCIRKGNPKQFLKSLLPSAWGHNLEKIVSATTDDFTEAYFVDGTCCQLFPSLSLSLSLSLFRISSLPL